MPEIDEKEIARRFEVISEFQISPEVTANDLERVREALTEQMSAHQPSQQKIWRIIMKSKITKLAAAAVVIIAVLIGVHYLGGSMDGTGVVWADVARKMETIDSFTCRKREGETNDTRQQGFEFVKEKVSMYWYSVEYGAKNEHYSDGELTVRSYRLRKTKELVAIFPPVKMYNRLRLSNEALSKLDQDNPRQLVRRFLSADYKPLGRDIIDGIQVDGVEVKDQNIFKPPGTGPEWKDFVARLWVDVKNQLPVRLEAEHRLPGSSVWNIIVTDQFQWNVELTASDFEPNIPADYIPGTDELGTATQQK